MWDCTSSSPMLGQTEIHDIYSSRMFIPETSKAPAVLPMVCLDPVYMCS